MNLSSRLFLALSVAPLVVAQTPFTKDVLALNPLGFWTLNGNANDSSTHANNGMTNGMFFTNLANCPVEPQAAVFSSASDQFITVPNGGSLFNLGALHAVTAMAWIRTVGLGRGSQVILGKFDPVANTGWAIGIDNGDFGPMGGGRFVFVFVASGKPVLVVETTVAVANGVWNLVSATYDGSGAATGVHLYVNGVDVPTSVIANALGNSSILNTFPLTIGAGPDGSSQFEGNMAGAAVFGVALTAAENLKLADDSNAAGSILSQFAFGGGWYSAVYFSNITQGEVSFPVNFTGDNGSPLSVPVVGASIMITLPPGGSTVIEAPNVGSTVQQGYVRALLPIGVTGYGVFRQSVPGVADQEAVVPFAFGGGGTEFLVFDETNFVTGVAIVNTSPNVATIAITITDPSGSTIGTSSVVLQPFTKTESALAALPGLSQITGKQGVAKFTVTSASVAVLGLRFKGLAFTSIPAQYGLQLTKFVGTF